MNQTSALSPQEALLRLREGNRRFFTGQTQHPNSDADRLALAAKSNQCPHAYATVLSCSDSRVPVEIIFDAGIMDIFVIRVAGNLWGQNVMASLEYGAAHVKTPVLVVLGHTDCGAVTAAVNTHLGSPPPPETHIPPLLDRLFPAVEKAAQDKKEESDLVTLAVEQNVRMTVAEIFEKSPAIRDLVQKDKVRVLGAIYHLDSGRVSWMESS